MTAHAVSSVARRHRRERLIQRHLDAVERLLAALDAEDGDADLEPSLGALGGALSASWADQRCWAAATPSNDLEESCEDEGATWPCTAPPQPLRRRA